MKLLSWMSCALAGLSVAVAAENGAVCKTGEDHDLSYIQGLRGFRLNENFVREWHREPPDAPFLPPTFLENLRFNGEDSAIAYRIELDDGQDKPPSLDKDRVSQIDGQVEYGANGRIESHWRMDQRTLFGQVWCNALSDPAGACRLDLIDPRSQGYGTPGLGPNLTVLFKGGEVNRLCLSSLVEQWPEQVDWILTLDGRSNPMTTRCVDGRFVDLLLETSTIDIALTTPGSPNAGKSAAITIRGSDFAVAYDFAQYVRKVAYPPSPEDKAWIEDLVARSKAMFAAAGENRRRCTTQEPPV